MQQAWFYVVREPEITADPTGQGEFCHTRQEPFLFLRLFKLLVVIRLLTADNSRSSLKSLRVQIVLSTSSFVPWGAWYPCVIKMNFSRPNLAGQTCQPVVGRVWPAEHVHQVFAPWGGLVPLRHKDEWLAGVCFSIVSFAACFLPFCLPPLFE